MILLKQLEINWDESNKAFATANHAFLDRRLEVHNKYRFVLNRANDVEYIREEAEVYELFRKRNSALTHSKQQGKLLGERYKALYPLLTSDRSENNRVSVFT
jgi:cell shape-determining protein MreC